MTNLTPREHDVAALIAEGLSNKLIADQLDMSEHTAKFHVRNVCRKFGTTSRVVVAVSYTVERMLRMPRPLCNACEVRQRLGSLVF